MLQERKTAMSSPVNSISLLDFIKAVCRESLAILRAPMPIVLGLWGALRFGPEKKQSLGKLLEQQAARIPHRPAVRFNDLQWSYQQLNARANQVAALLQQNGIRQGDVVAIMMEAHPELLACIAGTVKLGAIAGILNHNQREDVLAHSIGLIKPKLIIVAAECVPALSTTHYTPDRDSDTRYYCLAESTSACPPNFRDLAKSLALMSDRNPATTQDIRMKQPCFYVFTSGTTGMPKASIMTHYRWLMGMCGVGLFATRLRADDVLYVTLPFYHNNALTVSWGSAMGAGACMALSRKFSVSRFWEEVRHYRATAFCYIGELCSYLLNQPPSPLDRQHAVRTIAGNGLRPEIWQDFKQRFGIERVAEFYGASECNLAFINYLNMDRTVGMCPLTYAIIGYDPEQEIPQRNQKGKYQRVRKGDTGLLITKINELAPFDGYTDSQANEKKLLRNVFKRGDCWFNTGDLVRDMGFRHIQFVDRLGDTFRWKGENVATTEVEVALNRDPQIEQSVVYGVRIPNTSGRAGMAAITLTVPLESFDTGKLVRTLQKQLPSYAIPLFLRVRDQHEVTGTFKNRKVELKRDGFNLEAVNDPVYWFASREGQYKRLDTNTLQAICSGDERI
jgi:acyl-CoA synthetase (AMP-forming)/AMP-acid ligase II